MKKKQIVHFPLEYRYTFMAACGKYGYHIKITDHRNRVTCKRCKATKRFRKVK